LIYYNLFNITGSPGGTGPRDFNGCALAPTDEAKNGEKTTVSKDPHTHQQNFQSGDVDIDVVAGAGGPENNNLFNITGSPGGTGPRDFNGCAIASTDFKAMLPDPQTRSGLCTDVFIALVRSRAELLMTRAC
jgi:hypothetical protein